MITIERKKGPYWGMTWGWGKLFRYGRPLDIHVIIPVIVK